MPTARPRRGPPLSSGSASIHVVGDDSRDTARVETYLADLSPLDARQEDETPGPGCRIPLNLVGSPVVFHAELEEGLHPLSDDLDAHPGSEAACCEEEALGMTRREPGPDRLHRVHSIGTSERIADQGPTSFTDRPRGPGSVSTAQPRIYADLGSAPARSTSARQGR